MLWVAWRVVTAGSVIYMGSQMGVFTEILVTHPGSNRGNARVQRTGFPGCNLPPAGVLNNGVTSMFFHMRVRLLIDAFVNGPGAVSEL